jgi:hypothetical protein
MLVEETPAVDLCRLFRALRRGTGKLTLAPGVTVRFDASPRLLIDGAGWVRLHPPSGAPQLLRVTSVPAPHGGRHAYLDLGGRRASKLHLAPDGSRFASRQALGLSYRVHHVSTKGRVRLRVERVRAALGFYGVNGVRPGEMSLRRYEDLVRRAEDAGVRVPVVEEPQARAKMRRRGRWNLPRDERGRWLSDAQVVARLLRAKIDATRRELRGVR